MRKYLPFLIIVYALATYPDGHIGKYVYEGMTPKTVTALLKEQQTNNPTVKYQIVSKHDFDKIPDPIRNGSMTITK